MDSLRLDLSIPDGPLPTDMLTGQQIGKLLRSGRRHIAGLGDLAANLGILERALKLLGVE